MANNHAPLETHWTTFVDYLREHGIEIEAVEAQVKAHAHKRTRKLAAAYKRRYQR
jgi:hypothetical protein